MRCYCWRMVPLWCLTGEDWPRFRLLLDLPMRARNALLNHYNYNRVTIQPPTLGDVADMPDRELLAMNNVGKKTIREIRQALADYAKTYDCEIDHQPPQPVFGEWQSIDTAPKDGTWILVYERAVPGHSEADIYMVRWTLTLYNNECWELCGCTDIDAENITHWMPLPAPPEGDGC